MFVVDPTFRLRFPAPLSGSSRSACYGAVEVLTNLPVWVLHVLRIAGAAHDVDRWQRFMVSDIGAAAEILALNHWRARNLYVLLPTYLTGRSGLTLALCNSVWECLEPEGDEICWRIETEEGVILDSSFGTEPGLEHKRRLLWSTAGADEGKAR